MNIKVTETNLDSMLTPKVEYRIPEFQRAYSWKKSQIEQFLTDIWDACEESQPYFIGTIVLINDGQTTNGIQAHRVLDGQQRLTTVFLVLSEFKTRYLGIDHTIDTYLKNTITLLGSQPKLVPQNFGGLINDQLVFNTLIDDYSNATLKYPKHQMVLAAKEIKAWMNEKFGVDTDLQRLTTFSNFFTSQVEIAKISTNSENDAFRLFETLNDRGLPLSKSDLIKNLLFRCAEPTQYESVKQAWITIEENAEQDGTDSFLRAYWNSTDTFVRKSALFDVFKKYLTHKPALVDPTVYLLEKLKPASDLYWQIRNPESFEDVSEEVKGILIRLADSGGKTYIPLLMAAFNHRKHHFERIAKIIESVYVRSLLIGQQNPNWLEIFYAKLSMICQNPARTDLELFNHEDFDRIDQDEKVLLNLQTLNVSQSDSWRNILVVIAEQDMQKEVVILDRKLVHIEHILPQNPKKEWFSEAGFGEETYSDYVSKVGNLTLLFHKLNSKASNRPFADKREIYAKSHIPMTRDIGEKEQWTQDDIVARTEILSRKICELFPHPYDIK